MAKRTWTRSAARTRQQHLFLRKGQLASMKSVLSAIMCDMQLTPAIRNHAHFAYFQVCDALNNFNAEVGWPKKEVRDE